VLLSAKGRKLSQALGRHYADIALDAVFCSDLQRAYVTAEIAFGERGIPIVRDARLREFDYGQLTQQPPDSLKLKTRLGDPFPGGESILMALRRVGDFLRDCLRDYDGQTVAVIDHQATKYGLEYWSGTLSLEAIVNQDWEWRDIPIWRYEFIQPLRSDPWPDEGA
jgi:alpha-ribazole phosphatase/probable phosphoglycerate mutase